MYVLLIRVACLIHDPQTKRNRPRNYLEILEERVARLEAPEQTASSHSTSPPVAPCGNNDHGSGASNSYTPGQSQGDGTSDLSARVGMLDFRTVQMEPQYLGSSSAFAFSRIVNFSLNRDLPTEPTFASLSDTREALPTPCFLPEYDVATMLGNAYFKHIHPQYPFLHEPKFRAWEAAVYDPYQDFNEASFSSVPLFFLNMVRADGSSGTLSTANCLNTGIRNRRLTITQHTVFGRGMLLDCWVVQYFSAD